MKMINALQRRLVLLFVLALSFTGTKAHAKAPSHAAWDALLKKYVSASGFVNYADMKGEKSKLDKYIYSLQKNVPTSSWSKKEEMAYWINLYNAFTVQIILDEYPVKSILKIDGGDVWNKRRIKIGSKSYTLNQIEKEQLLKKFKEPRVHFAVNCAAKSCPPLMNRAWTADRLEKDFEARAKLFINSSQYNQLSSSKIAVSKIFEWYAGDFNNKVLSYVQKYSKKRISSTAKVTYLEYNWDLNGK